MSERKKSTRQLRRADERARDKLLDARSRLAQLEPGGNPARPLEVVSASLVEPGAVGRPCVRCDGRVRVEEHAAEVVDGARLRVVRVRCADCGSERTIYFRVGSALPN